MTEPVQKIGKATEIGQRKGHRDRLGQAYGDSSRREKDHEDDLVDISEEARSRAEGRHRKSILEHLEEQ